MSHVGALVQLAIDRLNCRQKELAMRLGVSPAQISKWKKGEYMSMEMETKLRGLAELEASDPEFVLWAGSREDAKKWERLLRFLAGLAVDASETGYSTPLLEEEEQEGLLFFYTFDALNQMGVKISKPFPEELDFDYDDIDDPHYEERVEQLTERHPISSLINATYRALANVYGFYSAYVSKFVLDDNLDLGFSAGDIECCLLKLAATKLEALPAVATTYADFKRQVEQDYVRWLKLIKEKAFRAGMPLRAELLELVYLDDDALGQEADKKREGFNDQRLHPDVYMNELLRGMRLMHQVLPAVIKKLGISQDELNLDMSDLYIGQRE